ncbi:hypothetical protein NG798_10710 [Ancylothrix sp. C2]|nr:hypothetical protein [Ancylothrix sp. D3o]
MSPKIGSDSDESRCGKVIIIVFPSDESLTKVVICDGYFCDIDRHAFFFVS